MQFGIFSVGDVTPDPVTGRVPSEAERIQAMVRIALKAEEVGGIEATVVLHLTDVDERWRVQLI